MVAKNRSRNKNIRLNQEIPYQQKMAQLKETVFELTFAHLKQNQNANPYIYYLFLSLEHVALLWFILHSGLGVYKDVYFLDQVRTALQVLNFHQFLSFDAQLYKALVIAVFAYLLVQIALIILSLFAVNKSYEGEVFKYLRKIVNFQFLMTVRVLTGPFLGLTINVLYCNQNNPYHVGQVCYDATHIAICALSAIVTIIVLSQNIYFTLIYYFKNPLSTSYLGEHNRYYILTKTLIKILMPVYFAIDGKLQLYLVFLFCVTGIWGGYLFWHRLFSIHTYHQKHFYVQYFMEVVLFWMSLNNIIYYYVAAGPSYQKISFIYSIASSMLIAMLMISIEKAADNKFVKECLLNKVKKQNMEKFVYLIIDRFMNGNTSESKLIFRVYQKVLNRNMQIQQVPIIDQQKQQVPQKMRIYKFLCQLVDEYLKQNSSVMLKTFKCYLLCLMGQKSYGIHQSLQLQEERLSLVDQFMLFQFRKGEDAFTTALVDKQSRQFAKFYYFHQELGKLQELIQICALDTSQYWQQLCQADPSLAKLRNLATLYNIYEDKIKQQYGKVSQLFPQSLYAANLYFNFLMNVGVDIREAIKMKEKVSSILQGRLRSVRVSDNDINQNEEVSIIAVDSIGSNLGVVINSNTYVKDLLGFERQGLIGKNITKIMPKIYAQLHNTFMMNFIRSEGSHNRPSDKIVTALNKNSLLIEIKLTVRMINSNHNSLIIVGFMKKIVNQTNKSLIMYSATSGEILGIDKNFVNLMGGKLSGKQVVQEEVRLNVLFPEVNFETLEKQGSQITMLEISNLNQEELNNQLTFSKKVNVSLKGTKLYEGLKLGFINVSEVVDESLSSLAGSKQLSKQMKQIRMTKVTPQNLRFVMKHNQKGEIERDRKRKRTDDLSINISQSQMGLNQSSDGLSKELPLTRKLQDYIKNKESDRINWIIKSIYLICVLGCSATALSIYFSHIQFLNHAQKMYLQLNATLNVAYYEAQINLYVSKIWNTSTSNFTDDSYGQWIPKLKINLDLLGQDIYLLTTVTQQYPFSIEYNSNYLYNFTIFIANGSLFSPIQINLNGGDGLANYISAASSFVRNFNNYTSALPNTAFEQQALYIQKNGESALPNIAVAAMRSYLNYFVEVAQNEMSRLASLKATLLSVATISLIAMAVLGNFLNKINVEVVNFYRSLRLWDINQMLSKCSKFLEEKGLKTTAKQRNSSLLKIFPNKTLLDIIQTQKTKQQLQKSKFIISESHMEKSKIIMNEDNNTFEEGNGSPGEPTEAEQALLRGGQKQEMVHVQWQLSNKKMVIGIVVILAILGGVIGLSYMMTNGSSNTMQNQMIRLVRIGQVRKYINYFNYFAFRLINNPKDQQVRSLLINQINNFYTNTAISYQYLGDPNPILRNIYTFVQTLQQWLTISNSSISPSTIVMANYSLIQAGLSQGSLAINILDANTFFPEYKNQISTCSLNQLIFTIVVIVLLCFVVVLMHCLYLQPIQGQCRHSLNMLKIIPAWIIKRNPETIAIISQ